MDLLKFANRHGFAYLFDKKTKESNPANLLQYFKRDFNWQGRTMEVVTLSKDFSNFMNAVEKSECARLIYCLSEQAEKVDDVLYLHFENEKNQNGWVILITVMRYDEKDVLHIEKRG